MGLAISRLRMRSPRPGPPLDEAAIAALDAELDLDFFDQNIAGRNQGVTSITFFPSMPDINGYLESRVEAIVDANPWLASRLVAKEGGGFLARYPSEAAKRPGHLRVMPPVERGISSRSKYRALCRRFARDFIPFAEDCVGTDTPLFKVLVYPLDPKAGGGAVVLVTMWLSQREDVVPMIATRAAGYWPEVMGRQNPRNKEWLFRRIRVSVYRVDLEAIARAKEAIAAAAAAEGDASAPQWVSTNDVLTAWFFGAVKHDVANVAMNTRRMGTAGITEAHAGNYIAIIAMNNEESVKPRQIRAALDAHRAGDPQNVPLIPGGRIKKLLAALRASYIVHNGRTEAFKVMDLPGAGPPSLTLPVRDPGAPFCRNVLCGGSLHSMMIAFRPREGELAVLLMARGLPGRRIRGTDLLSEPLLPL